MKHSAAATAMLFALGGSAAAAANGEALKLKLSEALGADAPFDGAQDKLRPFDKLRTQGERAAVQSSPNSQEASPQKTASASPKATRDRTELDARASASMWSSTRLLDDQSSVAFPQLTAKLTHKLESGVSFVLDGYGGHERALSSEHSRGRAALREAYVSVRQGPAVVRLGSQIVSWGRADVINPTDNVSAQDYTSLVDGDGEQKLGLPSANLTLRLGEVSVQTIWQPSFRASSIPLPQREGIRYVDHKPDDASDAGGIRIDSSGERLSWSASWCLGPSKRPNLAISPERIAQGVVDLNHPDASIFGLDFELLRGSWVLRGEAAYHELDDSGADPLSSRESFALAVLGVERDFGPVSVFVQGIYRRTYDFLDPDRVPEPLRAGRCERDGQ